MASHMENSKFQGALDGTVCSQYMSQELWDLGRIFVLLPENANTSTFCLGNNAFIQGNQAGTQEQSTTFLDAQTSNPDKTKAILSLIPRMQRHANNKHHFCLRRFPHVYKCK